VFTSQHVFTHMVFKRGKYPLGLKSEASVEENCILSNGHQGAAVTTRSNYMHVLDKMTINDLIFLIHHDVNFLNDVYIYIYGCSEVRVGRPVTGWLAV